jgi:nitrite reductase (NO-forming)
MADTPRERGEPAPAVRQLISLGAPPREPGSRSTDRGSERRTVLGGLVLAAGFLFAGLLAAVTSGTTSGSWLPLHLALAGAAGIAIGTMLPHFMVSLAAASPAPALRRRAGLALLSVGVAAAAVGMSSGPRTLAAAGGIAYISGLAVTAWTGFVPARAGLGRRAGIVDAAYGLALVNGAAAVLLAVLMLLSAGAVDADWPALKPAHAWLNLAGFVSLVIAGTLVHLYPTVIGGRIRVDWTLSVLVLGLGVGAPVAAAGYAFDVRAAVTVGALGVIAAAFALIVYAAECWRARGAWRTELPWHRVAIWHLNAGIGWFAVGALAMAWGPLTAGADPAGWQLGRVWGPWVMGWALQVLVGAWTHLLPAVGPGDIAQHAAQRAWLARSGPLRLGAWNVGTALLVVGGWVSATPLALAGAALVGATMLASVGLLAAAVADRRAGAAT